MVPGAGEVTDLLVDAVATYRLTRLVTADTIADPIRERVVEAAYVSAGRGEEIREVAEATSWSEVAIAEGRHAPKIATLVTCRWCAGMWIAFAVVAARRVAPRSWRHVATALACSAAAALLAGLEES